MPAFQRSASPQFLRSNLAALPLALFLPVLAAGFALLGAERTLVNLLIAPWVEEFLLRSGLQDALHEYWRKRRWRGARLLPVVVCAFVFAGAHVALRPDAWSAATVLPSLAVGCVYAYSRMLAPCVLLHALFNLLWFAVAGPWLLSL